MAGGCVSLQQVVQADIGVVAGRLEGRLDYAGGLVGLFDKKRSST